MTPTHLTKASPNAAIVIGASGGIGRAMVEEFCASDDIECVYAVSRSTSGIRHKRHEKVVWLKSDSSEHSMKKVCSRIANDSPNLRSIVITIGSLHNADENRWPEKRIEQLSMESLRETFDVNSLLPILWLKSLCALFTPHSEAKIAVLSARVGSIEDNRLGGWYAYRSAKSALNMLLKTASIEFARRFPKTRVVAFHPGTTDTPLSRPFQARVAQHKLLTPAYVAQRLNALLESTELEPELAYADWQHEKINW